MKEGADFEHFAWYVQGVLQLTDPEDGESCKRAVEIFEYQLAHRGEM